MSKIRCGRVCWDSIESLILARSIRHCFYRFNYP